MALLLPGLGGIQDVIKQLQTNTPKGEAIVITDDMFAEMAEDYPQLATQFRTTLEKVLKGARGTGTASESVDPSVVTKLVQDGIKAREIDSICCWPPESRPASCALRSRRIGK